MNSQTPAAGAKEIDPVCGMTVDPARAAATVHWGDRTGTLCEELRGEIQKRNRKIFFEQESGDRSA